MNDFLHRYGVPDEHFNPNKTTDEALSSNHNLKAHHIEKLVDTNDEYAVERLIDLNKLQPHHIDKILSDWGDFSFGVKRRLIDGQNLQPHHIDKLIGYGDKFLQRDLASHSDLQPHHIDRLLNLNDRIININLGGNKNLQPHHIDKMIIDGGSATHSLISRKDLLPRHIDGLIHSQKLLDYSDLLQYPLSKEQKDKANL